MLGKRFRRTTSMSHLGPASPPPAKVSEKALGASTPHSVPHKAARPLVFQAHVTSENDAAEERSVDHVRRHGGIQPDHVPRGGIDVNLPGCASASSENPKPFVDFEESCAVDHVNDMDMEGMVVSLGCDDIQSDVMTAYWCGALMGLSDNMMMEGNHAMVHANGGMMMKSRYSSEEQPSASLMAYQMGLWIKSSMNGSGKLLKEEEEQPISPVDFLDVCFHCKRRLRHERDIYIYRGDTAFCSEECRYRQIVKDERRANNKNDNKSGSKRGGGGSRSRAAPSSTEITAVAA
ncbi:hypothetical protein L7F22_010463 [Adiantum nelumboides]|nr:hypothetical protein [Adiantum nelumboides]